MKLRLENKNRAICLRKTGLSFKEIRQQIPNLSKSTLCGWLKGIELTEQQKIRLLQKMHDGAEKARFKGSLRNREKALERIATIRNTAKHEYSELKKMTLFPIGLSLYWAEGAKKSRCFQFMNSDPQMIKLMLKWLTEIVKVNMQDIKFRLYTHKIFANESYEIFWSKITGLPVENFYKTIYKPTPHLIKKNPEYKGCVRLEITKSEIYWKMVQWQQMMIDEYV